MGSAAADPNELGAGSPVRSQIRPPALHDRIDASAGRHADHCITIVIQMRSVQDGGLHLRGMRKLWLAAVLFLVSTPTAAAEFGPESADGWPINVEGEVLRPPVVAVDPLNKVGPFTFYPYYPLLTAEVQRLALDHPDLVRLTSAGKSTAQLDMWLLEIADFAQIEAGEGIPLEEREVLYIDGGTHSNEYSGVYFVTELAQFLLDDYETNDTARWIVENRHTWILPMVNPDGSNAFGRLNAKLVNVNRNFPGTWGAVEEDPVMNNPGAEAASEPETQNVIALLDLIQPDYVNSIHCCGNLWLHPWGAEDIESPADMQMFTRICDEAFADVREYCGEIWSTIYPASGTTADEGYSRVGASSWSYEMSGRGAIAPWGQPTIVDDVRVQEVESWNGVMHAFQNVEKYGARPRILAVDGDDARLSVTIVNDGWGNLSYANVSANGATAPVPPLLPGERAVVELVGSFEPGTTTIDVDFQKRHWLGPQGVVSLDVPLAREGRRLVGLLDADGIATAAAPEGAAVPGPSLLAIAAIGALAAIARRRG